MYSEIIASFLAVVSLTTAQTTTKCNPLTNSKSSTVPVQAYTNIPQGCPANPGLSGASYSVDFTAGQHGDWTGTTAASYSGQGVALAVTGASDSPSLYSNFYFLFGRVEAKIKAAPGVGVVSSLVLLSDDLDEIDFEWLGGSPSIVQTNYFGKGNTTTYDREQNANVAAATTTFHTYAIDWTSSAITWYIDGTPVRTLNYADAVGGKNFPQTPCRIGIGAWPAGSSPSQGTREWAGGAVDFSQGPFVMYTQSISIVNYNPAQSYQYGDQSGSYQSIQVTGGKGSSVVGSGSNSNANSPSGVVSSSPSSSNSAAAIPVPTSTSPTSPPVLPNPSTSASSPANNSPSSKSQPQTTTPAGTNPSQTTTQSAAPQTSSSASSATISHSSSTPSHNSTTVTTKTSTSLLTTSTVHSSTSSQGASTSSATSASPSNAPNAAATTINKTYLAGTLVSMLAFAFGMLML